MKASWRRKCWRCSACGQPGTIAAAWPAWKRFPAANSDGHASMWPWSRPACSATCSPICSNCWTMPRNSPSVRTIATTHCRRIRASWPSIWSSAGCRHRRRNGWPVHASSAFHPAPTEPISRSWSHSPTCGKTSSKSPMCSSIAWVILLVRVTGAAIPRQGKWMPTCAGTYSGRRCPAAKSPCTAVRAISSPHSTTTISSNTWAALRWRFAVWTAKHPKSWWPTFPIRVIRVMPRWKNTWDRNCKAVTWIHAGWIACCAKVMQARASSIVPSIIYGRGKWLCLTSSMRANGSACTTPTSPIATVCMCGNALFKAEIWRLSSPLPTACWAQSNAAIGNRRKRCANVCSKKTRVQSPMPAWPVVPMRAAAPHCARRRSLLRKALRQVFRMLPRLDRLRHLRQPRRNRWPSQRNPLTR